MPVGGGVRRRWSRARRCRADLLASGDRIQMLAGAGAEIAHRRIFAKFSECVA